MLLLPRAAYSLPIRDVAARRVFKLPKIVLKFKKYRGYLKTLRAATSRIGKEYAARGSNSTTAQEAKDLLLEGMAELEQLYEHSVSTQK